jgi:hypothetical protein
MAVEHDVIVVNLSALAGFLTRSVPSATYAIQSSTGGLEGITAGTAVESSVDSALFIKVYYHMLLVYVIHNVFVEIVMMCCFRCRYH